MRSVSDGDGAENSAPKPEQPAGFDAAPHRDCPDGGGQTPPMIFGNLLGERIVAGLGETR